MNAALGLLSLGAVMTAAGISVLTYVRARQTGKRVEEVHVLVNNRLDVALERIAQLGATLHREGIEIPERPDTAPPPSDHT